MSGSQQKTSGEPWKVYYWPNEILQGSYGRSEYVRLVLEEAGADYKMVQENTFNLFKGGQWQGYPTLAVPVLEKGDFCLSQTGVICKYLGKQYGLYPTEEADQWHAEQLNTTIHDFVGEARLSFHGKYWYKSYYDQVEETKPYQEMFIKERIPKFFNHFEKALAANNGGKGFLVGDKATYVDLAMLHVLRGAEAQFPEAWVELKPTIPLLVAFRERMEARPNLAAYFKSDRWRPFSGNSFM